MVLGLVAGAVCLVALFALLRVILAAEDARAYSEAAGTPGQMTVTYAGLEAPLASSHPGMRAPSRICIVALDGGTARYAAQLDGRACGGLQVGHPTSVLTWRGRVIAVDGWATATSRRAMWWHGPRDGHDRVRGRDPDRSCVRVGGNRRPSWYAERLKR
jgi:hypothetical protein